jgi:WD40 repeat protein
VPDLESPREIVLAGHKLFGTAPLADGRIALAADDALVRLWSPDSGTVTGQWQPANPRNKRTTMEMYAIIASQDGKCVLSHGEHGLLRMWEAPGGRELMVTPCNLGAEPLAVSRDGRLAAWTAANPTVRSTLRREGIAIAPEVPWLEDHSERAIVFDLRQRQMRMIAWGHSTGLRALAFSADGRRLATGDSRGHLKLWDTETGYEILSIDAHLNPVFGIAFHPSGKQLATVGADGLVRIWPRK